MFFPMLSHTMFRNPELVRRLHFILNSLFSHSLSTLKNLRQKLIYPANLSRVYPAEVNPA